MNLLKQAHKLIPFEKITLASFQGRVRDELGNFTNAYTFSEIVVKINAVKTEVYRDFGLDYKRKYFIVYSIPKLSGLTRENSGDLYKFNNQFFQLESEWGWAPISDWDAYLSVEIQDDGVFP